MDKLCEQIENIDFITKDNFSYDLNREFELIRPYLAEEHIELIRKDFDCFLKKGKFYVLNTFAGGILFLKVSEIIDKIKIDFINDLNEIISSVLFFSETREQENIKYKPFAGKIESVFWKMEVIFPNFSNYQKSIKSALILIIGKIVKRICEYGRTHFAHLKIENEFYIELFLDGELISNLKVEIDQK